MIYSYYPGCCYHTSAKEYDISSRAVCAKIGIQLQDVPDWSCCGSSAAHTKSHVLATSLAARNLSLAEEAGHDIVASCAACYQRLATANHALKSDARLAQKVNSILERSYRGNINVRSMLDIIYDLRATLESNIVKQLKGISVAAYYGCLLVRPSSIRVDDSEHPQKMDELMALLAAEPVEWGHKTECCGASLAISNEDIVLKLVHGILQSAVEAGADCIVTACPLCHFNLDLRQSKVNKTFGTNFQLPVFYFTQLIGICLGLSPREMSFHTHYINPYKILKAMGEDKK